MKIKIVVLLSIILFAASVQSQIISVPFIDTVHVAQETGSMDVRITYDVFDPQNDTLVVFLKVSDDGGKTFNVPAVTFTGDYGLNILPDSNKTILWDAGTDYPEKFGENFQVKLTVSDAKINKVVQIPEGEFVMGEVGLADTHSVFLDSYKMCPHAVTNEEYKLFCDMTGHDYPPEGGSNFAPEGYFLNYGNYPVVGVSWNDAVQYCNWLSELEGLDPCYNYYINIWEYDSTKNGYHLPTEAQWEKAARGGLEQRAYPWGDTPPDNQCNYISYSGILQNMIVDFNGSGNGPLPVDSLDTNGYELLNMAGNIWEWCNDWFSLDYVSNSPYANPLGPDTGNEKVVRGGAWNVSEDYLKCAFRERRYDPDDPAEAKRYDIGFRVVK